MLRFEAVSSRDGRGVGGLDGVSFVAHPGEVVAVLGPAGTGAGKSALLRILAGRARPTQGVVTLDGQPLHLRAARRRVGYAPDPPLIPGELTGGEWLRYLATYRASAPAARTRVLREAVEWCGLDTGLGRRVSVYDPGTIRRLALAAAILTGRRIVALDETFTGADTVVARDLRGTVARLARAGRIVVIASRDVTAVEAVATRALVLSYGSVAADVRMATLVDERVAELTLNGGGLAAVPELLARFPEALRTGDGIAIPLKNGHSIESVLSICHARRVPVAGSRVRYRMLEDIYVVAAGGRRRGPSRQGVRPLR